MNRREFIGGSAAAVAGASLPGRARASLEPNVIIIMADDLGYGDLGCYGSELLNTPHIDRMASEGVRFTSFYSCAPLCAPSRSGLVTGRYPIRNGVTGNYCPGRDPSCYIAEAVAGIGAGMNVDEITIGQVMKSAGYRTCCIGKWHLGGKERFRPNHRGFDHYFGLHYSNDMHPNPLWRNDEIVEDSPVDQTRLTLRYTEEALQFIEECGDRPFLLYLPHTFPHIPLHPSEKFRGSSDGGLYGDVVEEIDWSTGKILETLDRLGIADNTLVVFTSDNGPWYQGSTGGHRGRKNEAFEGGMRVPMIARMPGVIPAGTESDAPAMNIDLFTTAAKLAGADVPQDRPIDGKDLLPAMAGGPSPHHALYFYWLDNLHAVRAGRWKYHRPHRFWASTFFYAKKGPMLFDVVSDPEESYNLIELYPDKAREMEELMREWEENLVTGTPG